MGTEPEWGRLAELLGADEDAVAAVRRAVAARTDAASALLDALDDAGALAYLRADDSGVELADALAQLPRVFAVGADLDDASDVDDLPAATAIADGLLRASGVRLVRFSGDGEDWPLAAVPAGTLDETVELAARLGVGLVPVR